MLPTVAIAAAAATAAGSCGATASPIVAENQLPGVPATEWDVNGAGSYDVQGFATRGSVLPGARVHFKIAMAHEETLRVDIYRLGWYGGDGARKVGEATLVDVRAASRQPPCVKTEPEAELWDCGNWDDVAVFDVPPDATSGLYFARAVLPDPLGRGDPRGTWRADASRHKYDRQHVMLGRDVLLPPMEGRHSYGAMGRNRLRNALREPRASHIWFVVRAGGDAARSLLFQTSDTTWHAYNGWGGLTTYGSFEYPFEHAPGRAAYNLSDPDHDTRRAYKRSYNTPLITRDYRAVNMPLTSEYPAIRFLERNGYDVHYATGADLAVPARARGLLARSTAYVSVGHDEYWTYEQREAIEAARDAGLHLNFWSANEAYWAVRFEPSRIAPPPPPAEGEEEEGRDAAHDPPRTMVCYKETQSVVKLDPEPGAWTGTFRDDRDINPKGGMPENGLTGHMFAANAQRMDALVVDGGRYGRHRAWRGTQVSSMSPGDPPLVLYPGLLGHEWDEDVDNGWRPAGLQTLATTTVDNVQGIMDWGSTFDSVTATHSLVLHRRGNGTGAFVFGSGTVQWAWGLDSHHDVNDPQRANKYNIRVAADPRGGCPEVKQLTVNILGDMGVVPATLEPGYSLPPPSTDVQPPTGGLHELAVSEGSRVEASGWAADGGGGVVAAVEVSWDGSRYHPAELETVDADAEWRFQWGALAWERAHGDPPPRELSRVWLRLTDDSGNSAVLQAGAPPAAQ
ncbi:hypothetical protein EMIHUDRAFT_95099 [Emiliania huxleyi CCMP1516]|uniref:N,N-dimethylformamidase beta subunit-like C-terminal domain-containing protein n=2 Tax=Emiliania huxleyi TaxID=2903 RepID=A0A0D3L1L7_EMIH1|nr:hypothetical protein EMIHUDRAFT_95099 [Emiliania huxleyi CCMP1516]EOD41902.1 hypothetical protein EMIHUDRAFT_95099 [Emiliania huxleyi CCMP1516]|eukprot:XP_005794331.1 hypothetical protein EMIHUDRAFT_95099 [Emiliania huxleyi CCMP1516]